MTPAPDAGAALPGWVARFLARRRWTRPDVSTWPWTARLADLVRRMSRDRPAAAGYLAANADAIQRVVRGMGPDGSAVDPRAGARVVVNMSAVHVPAFCAASRAGDPQPYKNTYDIDRMLAARGQPPATSDRRQRVDFALPLPPGQAVADTYFGAVELHGTGVGFYGDVCLVLKPDRIDPGTAVLDRNSYDVVRAPASDAIDGIAGSAAQHAARAAMLKGWSGRFDADLGTMVATKVLESVGARERRLTAGQISAATLDDEDYVEVLRKGSFDAGDLQEARLSAGDAAHDALVATRVPGRPFPRMESLVWLLRRSEAERALRASGVPLTIVTTAGRTRS